MGKHSKQNVPAAAREPEGTGNEQGLQEDSGLHDDVAERGADTAAHLQDSAAKPKHA